MFKKINKIFVIFVLLCLIILYYLLRKNKKEVVKKIEKEGFQLPEYYKIDDNNYELPKTIYCFWHNYEEDDFIKLFIENWKRKLSPGWNIVALHRNNVDTFTNGKMLKYKDLDNTKYSDYLRLYLLKEHGGVWIDISTMIINGKFLDDYHEEMVKNKSECLVYEFKDRTVNDTYPYLENWFIMAPKNSRMIYEWFDVFDRAFEMGFLKFKKEVIINSGMDIKTTLGWGEDDVYLLMHACLNYLMYKGKKYNIIIKDAVESMFKLQNKSGWDNDKMGEMICNKDFEDMYSIKFISNQRNHLKEKECSRQILKTI